MLRLIKRLISVFKKTYSEELLKLQKEISFDLDRKIHEYRFLTDTKYREDLILKNAKNICKILEVE